MKVFEVIEKLKSFDQNLEVCINDNDFDFSENFILESVEVLEDHFINDFGNEVYGKFVCLK